LRRGGGRWALRVFSLGVSFVNFAARMRMGKKAKIKEASAVILIQTLETAGRVRNSFK
jgi:hypothetical protein